MTGGTKRHMCPECDGECGYWHTHHDQLCGTVEECFCEPEWHDCRECRGRGTVDGIQLAIYRARGGSAPVQLRGYA